LPNTDLNNLRFFDGNAIDAQGRVCIGDTFKPGTMVMIYTRSNDLSLIYVEVFNGDPNVPNSGLHKVGDKGRICIPKVLRGDYSKALISTDILNTVVLKLI
jgi:hypothetical protein